MGTSLKKLFSFRLRIIQAVARFTKAINYLALAILKREDLVRWNCYYYERYKITDSSKLDDKVGLQSQEEFYVSKLESQIFGRKRVLVLGCGEGRECIALARKGWQVTGVDQSEILIQTAWRNAESRNLKIDYRVVKLGKESLAIEGERYDLICFFGQIYHYIPSKQWRHAILNDCKQSLMSDGIILFTSPIVVPKSNRAKRANSFRKKIAFLFGGNPWIEQGDEWGLGSPFYHSYSSREEFIEEIVSANLAYREVEQEIVNEIILFRNTIGKTQEESILK